MQPKQHGGKRLGAGAPKGNFNGVRTGNHSKRMLMVYLAVLEHPDQKELAHELYHAGFFPPPAYRFNRDLRGLVTYLYKRWFDSPDGMQSSPIKCNQVHRRPRPDETPPADTNQRPNIADQR
jgi:hypothetical protein